MLRSIAGTAAIAVICTVAPPAQSTVTLTVHTGRGLAVSQELSLSRSLSTV